MKLLIVSPAFAPFSGVGAVRMTSLTKYLVEQGHDITVIRNDPVSWGKDSLKSSVPSGIELINVYPCEDDKLMVAKYKKVLDEQITIKNNKFDFAIFSCGPFYGIWLGPYIKKKYDLHYIIEQRDLWLFHYSKNMAKITSIKHTIFSIRYYIYESQSIRYSDACLTVSPRNHRTLMSRHPLYKKKIGCIFNGYENITISKKKDWIEYDYPYIAHFGKLAYYNRNDALMILSTVKQLITQGYYIKLVHIGGIEKEVNIIADEIGLSQNALVQTDYVSYEQGMYLVMNATICSIANMDVKTGFGTKIFDYIGVNKPIVAYVSPNSEMGEVLSVFENAFVCQNDREMVNAIKYIMENKITKLGQGNRTQYARCLQNQKYEELMKKCIKKDMHGQKF